MLFNSIEYFYLLSLSLIFYWAMPWVWARQVIIIIASAWFYISWSAPFFIMLIALICLNWVLGLAIDKTGRKIWLILGCTLNLGLLVWFKYAHFIAENIASFLGIFIKNAQSPFLNIILPLGISFYVFELISYLADIYRSRTKHERNPIAFMLFVLFFPHLIAGPICRAHQFIPQVNTLQKFNWMNNWNGSYWFLAGFALKCGVADGIAPYVNVIFQSPQNFSGLDNLLATIGFGVQIICDFWGYSLMALGAALLFGYTLPSNFNAPYSSLSIRDFWRRWHITLSNWLRDYLYITLGGSRKGSGWQTQRNLMLTMLLGGLWHGASWNFIIWGGIHGTALAIHRWYEFANLPKLLRHFFSVPFMAWLLTMIVVYLAWIFFRAQNFEIAILLLHNIFTPVDKWFITKLEPIFFELLVWYLFLQWLIHKTTWQFNMAATNIRWQILSIIVLTSFSLVYYTDGSNFIYFQF